MASYYISPTGNDTTGNGSFATPWLTLNKAHTAASSGDTIYFMNGTHTMTNETINKNLTFEGVNKGLAIVNAADAVTRWTQSSTAVWTFKKLIFRNMRNATAGSTFSSVGVFETRSNITIDDCLFEDFEVFNASSATYGAGLFRQLNTGVYTVTNSIFNVGNGSVQATLMGTDNALARNLVFDKSTFYNCASIASARSADITIDITNCIFWRENQSGSVDLFRKGNALVNIVVTQFDNNCTGEQYTTIPSGNNNITSDPQFVDALGGNFNLRGQIKNTFGEELVAVSPAIDTGLA